MGWARGWYGIGYLPSFATTEFSVECCVHVVLKYIEQ